MKDNSDNIENFIDRMSGDKPPQEVKQPQRTEKSEQRLINTSENLILEINQEKGHRTIRILKTSETAKFNVYEMFWESKELPYGRFNIPKDMKITLTIILDNE